MARILLPWRGDGQFLEVYRRNSARVRAQNDTLKELLTKTEWKACVSTTTPLSNVEVKDILFNAINDLIDPYVPNTDKIWLHGPVRLISLFQDLLFLEFGPGYTPIIAEGFGFGAEQDTILTPT